MKVYYPTRYIDEPASPPHAPNTAYRISAGREHWEGQGDFAEVLKIQMVYDGVVAGRRSPSYPNGADDWARVCETMERIRKGEGQSARGKISTP